MPKKVVQFVTNDLNYDQRLIKKCNSLSQGGFDVTLVGRQLPDSEPLQSANYRQIRFSCFFNKGVLFYAEINLRIFIFLLKNNYDIVTANDVDTALGCLLSSIFKRNKLFFDAHEIFTEVPELRHSKIKRKLWNWVEKAIVFRAQERYTVCDSLAELFYESYQKKFNVVRNLPQYVETATTNNFYNHQKYLIYQGALNEGRGVREYIDAMQYIPNCNLMICGKGDLYNQMVAYAQAKPWHDRILFKGNVLPQALVSFTKNAFLGLNLLENLGKNYYYALSNKFVDYIQVGVPSINMNWPEFIRINKQYDVAILFDEINAKQIANTVNALLKDEQRYIELHQNCLKAGKVLHWETERQKLMEMYSI